jgi:hypothetical protein
VPAGAVRMQLSLVSGGPLNATGTMLIDDLSVAKVPPPVVEVLPGNFRPNPGFELGDNLDNPTVPLPAGIGEATIRPFARSAPPGPSARLTRWRWWTKTPPVTANGIPTSRSPAPCTRGRSSTSSGLSFLM